MANILLASTSTIYGGSYLTYIQKEIKELFTGLDQILFIPYARPGGISHDAYTAQVAAFFEPIGIAAKGLHTFQDPADAILSAKGFFTGGGNTFLLVQALHALGLMDRLQAAVQKGAPYLGTSAGSNIAGVTMQTTNDMPIVYPTSFTTLGLVPFNLNPHFISQVENAQHMGESRETRIAEFHTQNSQPVVGLREGSWIRVRGEEINLEGPLGAKIFEKGKPSYELATGSRISF